MTDTAPLTSIDAPHPRKDRYVVIFVGAVLMGIGGLIFNVLPILLGSMADSLKLSHQQFGYVGSSFLLGFAGVPATAPLWFPLVDWRRLALASLIILAASLAACVVWQSLTVILLALFAAGTTSGLIFSLSVNILGSTPNSERSFIVATLISLLMAALWIWTMPTLVIPEWGMTGALLGSAGFAVCVVFLTPLFPKRRADASTQAGAKNAAGSPIPVLLGLTGLGIFDIGLIGLWSFLERMGREQGLSELLIAQAFSLEKLCVLLTCVAAFLLSGRVSKRFAVIASFSGICAAAMLLGLTHGSIFYIAAVCIFGVFWTFGYPFQVSAITDADPNGRYAGMLPAFIGVGAAIGPALAGQFAGKDDYTAVFMLMTGACFIGTLLILMALRMSKKTS